MKSYENSGHNVQTAKHYHHSEPHSAAAIINQLRQEAQDLRAKQRDYRALQDQMMALEQQFSRLNEEKRIMEEDYRLRVDSNVRLVQTLRAEVDEQAMVFDERRHQNCDLSSELDQHRIAIQERNAEVQRLKHELTFTVDQNSSLQAQKRKNEEELQNIRERNRNDLAEIERLHVGCEQAKHESDALTG